MEAKARWGGEGNVNKVKTTHKFRKFRKSGESGEGSECDDMETPNARRQRSRGMLEVVVGILGQCGSEREVRWPREREKGITTQTFLR